MALIDRLTGDLRTAQRSSDADRLRVLRTLISQIKYEAKESGASADDALVVRVIQRDIRRRDEAIELYVSGQRPEQAAAERAERAVISAYQPAQIDRDTMETIAREVIDEVGATGRGDIGKVMRPLMARLREQGTVDGRAVNALVGELLSGG
jgi:uncharacterized protein YqeY